MKSGKMKRCDFCGGDVGLDYVSAPDLIGVLHYSKIACAEVLKADVEKLKAAVLKFIDIRYEGSAEDESLAARALEEFVKRYPSVEE